MHFQLNQKRSFGLKISSLIQWIHESTAYISPLCSKYFYGVQKMTAKLVFCQPIGNPKLNVDEKNMINAIKIANKLPENSFQIENKSWKHAFENYGDIDCRSNNLTEYGIKCNQAT